MTYNINKKIVCKNINATKKKKKVSYVTYSIDIFIIKLFIIMMNTIKEVINLLSIYENNESHILKIIFFYLKQLIISHCNKSNSE